MAGTVMAHKYDPTKYADRAATLQAAKDAVAQLNVIIANADTATTAQLRQGLKDMAIYEKHLIRIVAGEVL